MLRRHLVPLLLIALGVAHTLAVAPHYHFGSFDDDASYVEMARAIAHGAGPTSHLPQGLPLLSTYPPGYPLLLAPLALVSGHAVWPYRLLSTVLFAVVLGLTWLYLGRRGVSDRTRAGVVGLLALNPVAATFATMVMAEMPFLVVLLVLVLLVDRWERGSALLTRAGVGACLCCPALMLLKQAAIGLVVGLVLWHLARRDARRAAAVALTTAVLLVPLAVIRLVEHTPLLGTRYSDELGGYYSGGLLHRIRDVLPQAFVVYVRDALPRSVVPTAWITGRNHGVLHPVVVLLIVTVAPLVALGFVRWVRHYRDCAVLVVPVYVVESLGWPNVNERRVILVLPFMITWYVLGAGWVRQGLRRAARAMPPALGPASGPVLGVALPAVGALLVVATLVVQLPRDYLFGLGRNTSRPDGSAYMDLLSRLGTPAQVVETDYLWTTSLLTGHRTRNDAFSDGCPGRAAQEAALRADGAAFVISGTLNSGGLGNRCLLRLLYNDPHSAVLYASPTDDASVFELIGAGTVHPGLAGVLGPVRPGVSPGASVTVVAAPLQTPGQRPDDYRLLTVSSSGSAVLTWSWSTPRTVDQLSTGVIAPAGGAVLTRTELQVRTAASSWTTVAAADGTVRFLLDSTPVAAVTGVRLLVEGRGAIAVHDVHALGTPAG